MGAITQISTIATPGMRYPGATVLTDGGYNLYRADTVEALFTGSPVAQIPAGENVFTVEHDDETAAWYGITTVSAEGVENTDQVRVIYCDVAGGVLNGARPNAIAWASARAVASAKIELAFEYDAAEQAGAATGIQVARCTGPDGAGADWDSPIQTISVPGSILKTVTLDPAYNDGETVYLAIRAVTAAGDAGPVLSPEGSPVVADSTGPAANELLTAQQA